MLVGESVSLLACPKKLSSDLFKCSLNIKRRGGKGLAINRHIMDICITLKFVGGYFYWFIIVQKIGEEKKLQNPFPSTFSSTLPFQIRDPVTFLLAMMKPQFSATQNWASRVNPLRLRQSRQSLTKI